MKKPNLNTIIAENLNKTSHVPSRGLGSLPNRKATVPLVSNQGYKNGLPPAGSHYRIPSDTLYNPTPYRIKATPNNGPSQWLEAYDTSNTQFPGADYVDEQHYDMGGYISDRAKATQFGQYAEGGSSWMLTNPNRISTYFPRMNNGGGLLSRKVTCSDCGWSWEAVDGGKDVMTCHKCGGMIKMKKGGVTTQTTMPPATQDSVRHLAGQMMDFEATKGSPSGTGLSDWGYHASQLRTSKVPKDWHAPQTKEAAVDMYMSEIANNPTLGYFNSAMEKGEAGDFLYNTGRDPRVYMLDQYLKSKGQTGLPNRGSYNVDTKTDKWTPLLQSSLDQQWNQYSAEINKLPTNTRRQLLNKGRDFYYQNTYSGNPGDDNDGVTNWGFNPDGTPKRGADGSLSPAYSKTWKPRIWESVNTYKKNGGDISIPDLNEYQIGGWLDSVVNTGKKYVRKAVDAVTHADPVNFLPFGSHLPANAKAFTRFAAANIGLGQGVPFVQKEDLTPSQLQALKQAAINAKKRTGSSKGGTKYSDYGKGKGQVWNNKLTLLTDPTKVAQTSVGRFTYGVNPNNSVNVSDTYNFNPSSTLNDQGAVGNIVHKFVDALDRGIPANDSRRNVNFDIYKGGGSTSVGQVTTQTTQPSGGILDSFFKNVQSVKKLVSSDSGKTPKQTVKAVAKLKKDYVSKYGKDYVDLMEAYGLDPFSKEGIAKAQELNKANPKTRIVCTAEGCSEIAVNAAGAFGNNYNRGNAWDLGNLNNVVATNPVYANQIGKGILSDPTSFTAPANMFQAGAIIGLNRKNTSKDNVRATSTSDANDSWDYANQKLYPGSRGNEHAGYMIDANTMLHGTGGHDGAPAYYMIDTDMSNGVSLPGNLNYQPVETIMPGSKATAATKGVLDTVKGWFNREGGEPCYECGGWLSQYADEGLEVTTQTTRAPIEGDWNQYHRYTDSLNAYNMDQKWEKVLDNLKNRKSSRQQITSQTAAFTKPFASQTRLQAALGNLVVKDKRGVPVIDKNIRLEPTDNDGQGALAYYSAKYVKPVQPVNKPKPKPKVVKKELVGVTTPVVQPQVAAAPIAQEYSGNGNPMYGPSNSLIGFMEGRNFVPATGKYTQGMNRPDSEILNNKEQLNKYIQGKFGAYALPVQRTGGWLDGHL